MGVSEVKSREGAALRSAPLRELTEVERTKTQIRPSLVDPRFDHDSCGVGFESQAIKFFNRRSQHSHGLSIAVPLPQMEPVVMA